MTHVWSQPNPNHNTKRFVCRQYLLFCLLNIPLIYICYFWELDLQLLSLSSVLTARVELNMCVELNTCRIEHVWNWTCVWKCGIEPVCGSVDLNMCVEVWNWTCVRNCGIEQCVWKCGIEHVCGSVELNTCVELNAHGIEHVWFKCSTSLNTNCL